MTGTDKKNLKGKAYVFVKHSIKWPHEFVLSGSTQERMPYDQLTIVQWVPGFFTVPPCKRKKKI